MLAAPSWTRCASEVRDLRAPRRAHGSSAWAWPSRRPSRAPALPHLPPPVSGLPGRMPQPRSCRCSGRALLGLAGAYLLRALTESGALPPQAGVAIGILYAILWLVWAARTPAARPRWRPRCTA